MAGPRARERRATLSGSYDHIMKAFDQELGRLRRIVLQMGDLAQGELKGAIEDPMDVLDGEAGTTTRSRTHGGRASSGAVRI